MPPDRIRNRRSFGGIGRSVREAFHIARAAAPTPFMFCAVCQIAGGAMVALQLVFGRRVIAGLVVPSGQVDMHQVVPPLLVALFAGAAAVLADQLRVDQQRLLGERTGRFVTDQVLDAAAESPLIRYEDAEYHDRLRRAQLDALTRPGEIASGVLGMCSAAAALIAIFVTMATVGLWFLVAIVAASIPALVASNRASRRSYEFEVEQTANYRERAYLFVLLLGRDSAKEMRAFDTAHRFRAHYSRLHAERISALKAVATRRAVIIITGTIVTSVLIGWAVVRVIAEVSNGSLSSSRAIIAVGALILASSRLSTLASSVGSIGESARFFDDLQIFLAESKTTSPSDASTGADIVLPGARRNARPSRLVFDKVSFSYPSNARPALCDVDLVVEPGEVVALVGANGSGKTTLVKLACGLYTPASGSIRMAGIELDEGSAAAWRRNYAVVFQDYVRYFLTVEDTIALGRAAGAADPIAVIDAARRVDADAFVRRLPLGYETRLGPEFIGGVDISGGEWQRMALARALYRDAPFVIFDEPSAALDPKAEAELFRDVRTLIDGRSALLVSHRFSSVRGADRIYVLDHGRVRESGTHDELMARGDHYAELFSLQASSYSTSAPGPA